MFRAVGLNAALRREIVLQTWFHEEAEVGCQVVLQTGAEGGRELPRRVESSLVAALILAIHVVFRMEGRADGDFGC